MFWELAWQKLSAYFSAAISFPVADPKLQQNSFKKTSFLFPQEDRATPPHSYESATFFPLENSAWGLLHAQSGPDMKPSAFAGTDEPSCHGVQTADRRGRGQDRLVAIQKVAFFPMRFQPGKKPLVDQPPDNRCITQKLRNGKMGFFLFPPWCFSLAEHKHMVVFRRAKIEGRGVHLHGKADPDTTDLLWLKNPALCLAAGGAGSSQGRLNTVPKPHVWYYILTKFKSRQYHSTIQKYLQG